MRSGEAMERGLRDCCRALRIGKILITTSEEFGQRSEPRVVYAKLPPGIESRKVLLMYPTLSMSLFYIGVLINSFLFSCSPSSHLLGFAQRRQGIFQQWVRFVVMP